MDLMNPNVAGYFIRVTFKRIPEIYYCKLRVYIIVSPFPKIQNISYQEVRIYEARTLLEEKIIIDVDVSVSVSCPVSVSMLHKS
jgi:hypothetical protein